MPYGGQRLDARRAPTGGPRWSPQPPPRPTWQPPIPVQPEPRRPHSEIPRRAVPENLTTWESDRVEQAAAFVADSVTTEWQEAVADRALECITPRTWNRLFHGHRQQECKVLAGMAKDILGGKKTLHDLVGSVASRVTGWFGGSAVEQAVVRELAKRIPIPGVDQKAAAVARGLQVIGIVLCLSVGSPLNRCQSFIDLALTETKERVKQILVGAMDDWTSPSPTMLAAWGARAQSL